MPSLYLIKNIAADGETKCLATIPEDTFDLFKNIIKAHNQNANWLYRPGIDVYKIDETFVRTAMDEDRGFEILYDETGTKYVLDKPIWVRDIFGNRKLNEGVEIVC